MHNLSILLEIADEVRRLGEHVAFFHIHFDNILLILLQAHLL